MKIERPLLRAWLPVQLLDHMEIPPGQYISGVHCCWVLKSGQGYLVGCAVTVGPQQFVSLYLYCDEVLVTQLLPGVSPPLSTFPDGAVIPFSGMENTEDFSSWMAELDRCPVLQTPIAGEKVTFQDRQGPYPVWKVTGLGAGR